MEHRKIRLVVWTVWAIGCSHSDIPVYVEMEVTPPPVLQTAKPSFETQIDRLDAIAEPGSKEARLVADVRHSILAQRDEKAGKWESASKHWFEAAKSADPRFGKLPFEKWIQALVKSSEGPLDSSTFARQILSETSQGEKIPYMMDRKLGLPTPLIKRLKGLIGDALTDPQEPAVSGSAGVIELAPVRPGIPSMDPLLVATSQRYCQLKQPTNDAWAKWERTLDRLTFVYWRALVTDCSGDAKVAAAAFGSVVPKMIADIAHGSRAAYAAGRLAAIERAAGDRQKAADAFSALVAAYDLPSISASDFGDNPREFQMRRINDTLWAGRYRALVGDVENAELFAKRAIELIDDLRFQFATLTGEAARKVSDFRSEAIQILAFRVALEKKKFEQAENYVKTALMSPDLTKEWRDRFTWTLGLYQYLNDDYAAAKATWEQMLNENNSEEYRPRLLFWIARCHYQAKEDEEAKFYLKSLGEEYPFNYYSVVAPAAAGLESNADWKNLIGDPQDLSMRFKEQRDFETKAWRLDKELGPLLERVEILVGAGLPDFAVLAARELETVARKRVGVAGAVPRFVYLSRLLHQTGDHHRAIWLTTDLSKEYDQLWKKYPEQILVAFPEPYQELFAFSSGEQNMEIFQLMAVARQESSFRPAVVSGAGAVGLMQIIPSTAERVNVQSKLKIDDIHLVDPKDNIRIGAAYLNQLSGRYDGNRPAVYAAYNAGEFAVDIWLEKRPKTDPTLWNELIPFKETNDYVKNVWRNEVVYRYLATSSD